VNGSKVSHLSSAPQTRLTLPCLRQVQAVSTTFGRMQQNRRIHRSANAVAHVQLWQCR
jgi:hypothetical protein